MRKLILALICIAFAGGAFAQKPQKIGHLNSQEIMYVMPEAKTLSDSLQTLQAEKQAMVESLQAELQQMAAAYERDEPTLDATMAQFRLSEINDKKQRIELFVQSAQESLLKAEQELMVPLQQKVMDAIKAVAEENGFNYIMDTGSGALIYTEGGIDVTDLLCAKLGIPEGAIEKLKNGGGQ